MVGHDSVALVGGGALLGAGFTYALLRWLQNNHSSRPGQPANAPVYLDHNASTPIAPEVADAMRPYLYESSLGNPSSDYFYGHRLKSAVEAARCQVSALLGCDANEVIFTSGGTESNNFAIRGFMNAKASASGRKGHIVTSNIEHPATSEVCAALEADGFTVTYVAVDGNGMLDPRYSSLPPLCLPSTDSDTRAVEAAVKPGLTDLITIMHANSEIGAIQHVKAISAVARRTGAKLHIDSAQTVAKVPIDVNDLGCDFLSICGHKLYAPKGSGALYIRGGTTTGPDRLANLVFGAGHERGLRPGTENVLHIVGLGAACEVGRERMHRHLTHTRAMRDLLQSKLLAGFPGASINGPKVEEDRLPGTLSIAFPGTVSGKVLANVRDVVCCSAGSACHSGVAVSAVLKAINIPFEHAAGTLRLSTGIYTTQNDLDRAADAILTALKRSECALSMHVKQ